MAALVAILVPDQREPDRGPDLEQELLRALAADLGPVDVADPDHHSHVEGHDRYDLAERDREDRERGGGVAALLAQAPGGVSAFVGARGARAAEDDR